MMININGLLQLGRRCYWQTISTASPSAPYYSRSYLSSAVVATSAPATTRIFHFGNNDASNSNIGNTNNNHQHHHGRRIRFSELNRRELAELEDALLSRLNNSRDDRLVDPLLGTLISRRGKDWIRSVSLPSSSNLFDDQEINDKKPNNYDGADSITVTIQPPTLLHPELDNLAENIARLVQEEMVSLLRNHKRITDLCRDVTPGEDTGRNPSPERGTSLDAPSIQSQDVGITIQITPRSITSQSSSNKEISNQGKALQHITHFLAVYSCKGGVGKSTIATNLAYQLASMGGRIGLLDLDVYGPSLPLLVRPEDTTVRQSPPELGSGMIEPIEHGGVKLMSLGYVSPESGVPGSGPSGGASVLRGPMAGRVVAQLLKGTNWGSLDVLILDLPPGTGDVQLEVCQSLSLSGAVAVSTPSSLAWADVRKGVQMFGEMGVSTLALVENMAYFICEGGGRHYPFGKSRELTDHEGESSSGSSVSGSESSQALAAHFLPNASHVFHLPISSAMNACNDLGSPLCLDDSIINGTEEERTTFAKLADAISTDLLLIQHGRIPLSSKGSTTTSGGGHNHVLSVMLDEARDSEFDVSYTQLSVDNGHRNFTVRLFSNEGGYQKVISGNELRYRDPVTGEVDASLVNGTTTPKSGCGGGGGGGISSSSRSSLSSMVHHHHHHHHSNTAADDTSSSTDALFPAKTTKKGNYGYQVEWADGTTTIYSLLTISKAAGGKPLDRKIN
jgi:Mrp family chromosome partitioning ATPase